MIFVNSMSDLFHENVSDDVMKQIFATMNATPQHTYQILTKRAERLCQLSPELIWSDNIWMGVSIESGEVIYRAGFLRETNTHKKFISAEPLLSSLDELSLVGIDWLIVGGESGPGSRPMLEEWVLALKSNAENAGTAFFFKQWGGTNKKKAGSLLQSKSYKAYPAEK